MTEVTHLVTRDASGRVFAIIALTRARTHAKTGNPQDAS